MAFYRKYLYIYSLEGFLFSTTKIKKIINYFQDDKLAASFNPRTACLLKWTKWNWQPQVQWANTHFKINSLCLTYLHICLYQWKQNCMKIFKCFTCIYFQVRSQDWIAAWHILLVKEYSSYSSKLYVKQQRRDIGIALNVSVYFLIQKIFTIKIIIIFFCNTIYLQYMFIQIKWIFLIKKISKKKCIIE